MRNLDLREYEYVCRRLKSHGVCQRNEFGKTRKAAAQRQIVVQQNNTDTIHAVNATDQNSKLHHNNILVLSRHSSTFGDEYSCTLGYDRGHRLTCRARRAPSLKSKLIDATRSNIQRCGEGYASIEQWWKARLRLPFTGAPLGGSSSLREGNNPFFQSYSAHKILRLTKPGRKYSDPAICDETSLLHNVARLRATPRVQMFVIFS